MDVLHEYSIQIYVYTHIYSIYIYGVCKSTSDVEDVSLSAFVFILQLGLSLQQIKIRFFQNDIRPRTDAVNTAATANYTTPV